LHQVDLLVAYLDRWALRRVSLRRNYTNVRR
jgi:hypothetical protein